MLCVCVGSGVFCSVHSYSTSTRRSALNRFACSTCFFFWIKYKKNNLWKKKIPNTNRIKWRIITAYWIISLPSSQNEGQWGGRTRPLIHPNRSPLNTATQRCVRRATEWFLTAVIIHTSGELPNQTQPPGRRDWPVDLTATPQHWFFFSLLVSALKCNPPSLNLILLPQLCDILSPNSSSC